MKVIYNEIPREAFEVAARHILNNPSYLNRCDLIYNGDQSCGSMELKLHIDFPKHLIGILYVELARIVEKACNDMIDKHSSGLPKGLTRDDIN